MEALVVLLMPLLIIGAMWRLTQAWFPGTTRLVERMMRSALRTVWGLMWRRPMREWGVLNSIWLWLFLLAVLATVGALQNKQSADEALGPLWLLVIIGWLALRSWGRFRYRPRGLPTRRRWRRD